MKDKLIDTIIENIKDKDIVDQEQLERLQTQRSKLSTNNINLAKLFIECFDLIKDHYHQLMPDKESQKKELEEYMDSFDLKDLRKLLIDHNNGLSIGDHYIEIKINKIIDQDRDKYNDLIIKFFRLFGEEE